MLEYKIIFDPAETWAHKDQFEQDFAKFFTDRGLEAEYIDMADSQKPHVRMLLIQKNDSIDQERQEVKEKSPQQIKRLLSAKRVNGKFQK